MIDDNSMPWYIAGLRFECRQCGRCCSGPGEGYIWVTKPEIELIAQFLDITFAELRRRFLRRAGLRTTIIEDRVSRDCIFLHSTSGQSKCAIYPVRPSQCRSWPFWSTNLTSPNAWNKAAQKCPGIGQGRMYSYDEIEEIKKDKKWWSHTRQTARSSKR